MKCNVLPGAKKIQSFTLLLLLFLMPISDSWSQSITNYTFAGSTGTFTALSGANNVASYSGTADDGYSNGIPIGFAFYYMGTRYTTASASSNGWITLGANITGSETTNNLSSAGSPRPVIAPLWDDLSIQATTNMTYLTTGIAPNRVFTLQYLNVKWNYEASGSTMSFQVKLYETSDKVEFVYRSESGNYNGVCCLFLGNTGGASIGISASGTGAGNYLSLNGTGITPTASSTTSTNNLTTKPATNTTYTFTPAAPTAPSNLTFTNVGISAMTLNWTDNSAYEIAYEIHSSTDNVNFNYVTRVGANVTSYTQNLLTGNTTYYWRVYAVRETLSSALSGSRNTCFTLASIPTNGLASMYKFNGNANDEAGINNGTFQGSTPTATTDRFGNANRAYTFNGTSNYISTTVAYNNPSNFSLSLWIKTTTTTGGRLIGFGDAQTGNSGSRERMIYMTNTGRIYFAVNPGGVGYIISSPASYNDGNWHHIVATCSNVAGGGTRLYMDGALVASNTSALGGQAYTGWWRINYDLIGWTDSPTSNYFNGSMDDILIYDRTITAAEVTTIHTATSDGANSNTPVCYGSTINLTSTAISSAAYAWTGPNSFSAASQNPSVSSAVTGSAGTYTVNATIGSCTSSASTTVAVTYNSILQIPAAGLIGNYKFNGNAYDESNTNPGTLQNAPTAVSDRFGIANSAYSFNGSSQYVSTTNSYLNPSTFTVSLWFNTTTTTGGKLIGFGNAQTGQSGNYDRHVYMNNTGQIYFGVYPGIVRTINSALSYNDGAWHMVTASLSPTNGIRLYIDGVLVASDATATSAENYTGYWKVGYDNLNGWTSTPSSFFFNGMLDDVLIYTAELTGAQVSTLYNSPDGAGNNGPVCVGNPLSFTGTTQASATYSWTGPNGFSSALQNPNLSAFTLPYVGTYTLTVTNGGCSVKAYTLVKSNTTTPGYWTGYTSNDWAVGSNWCGGNVPTSTMDVTIPSVVTLPNNTGNANTKNMTINASAAVSNSAAATLNIYGNFTNNGTLTNNGTYTSTGAVAFLGSTAQSIGGTSATTFNNLTINNATGVTLNSNATVNGILTLTTGTFTTNNLLNQNLYTGAIAGTGTGATTGNINFFKTIWGDRYHYISSPIGGLSAADWNDDVTIKFGANRNLFSYNEMIADTNKLVGWIPFASIATGLSPMTGYALFFPRWIYNTTLDVMGPYSHSTTYSNAALTNTSSTKPSSDGWNLIGNPYPSNIDWSAASGWTKTGLDNAIYTWDGRTNRFTSFVAGVGTNGGTRYIGSMQAFFVKVTNPGTGTLGMNNSVRVTSILHDVWRAEDVDTDKILRINAQSGDLSDETVIRFSQDATTDFDSEKDAYKILNSENTPSLFSLSPSAEYAINSLPLDIVNKTIPLQLNIALAGEYNLTSEYSDFTGSEKLFLEDRLLGVTQNLKESNNYTVHLPAGEHTGRFFIKYYKENNVTTNQTMQANSALEIAAAQQTVFILFNDLSTTQTDVAIFDALGKKIYAVENASINGKRLEIPLSNANPGIYIVKVQTSTALKTQQVFIQK